MIQATAIGRVTLAENGKGSLLAGRYRVVRQLGQGGMGSVWLVEDTLLDNKPFAVKMLPAILVSDKRAYRQLKDEALVAMKLAHPNIVTLRAFEENNGTPFLVMDYVDGQTLDDYLVEHALGEAASRRFGTAQVGEAASRRFTGTSGVSPVACGLPVADVLRLLRPIAAALDYAHSKGIVHRDVKPGNVMIAKDGTPYILDFGIAREIQETMTRMTGMISSGTLLYMSPEQLNGANPKPEQDVYSFAAMAYECLKGVPPFARGQIEFQIMNNPPDPLATNALTGNGATLAAGIMAGLAKKSEDRPASCAAVLEGKAGILRRDIETPRALESQPGRARSPSVPRRFPWKPLFAVAALTAVFVGGWWVTRTRNVRPARPARNSRTARSERETRTVEISQSATPVISRIPVPVVITNTVEEVKRVVVVTNVVQQVIPPEVPRISLPPVATNMVEAVECPSVALTNVASSVARPEENPVLGKYTKEYVALEVELTDIRSTFKAADVVGWTDEKDVAEWERLQQQAEEIEKKVRTASRRAFVLAESIKSINRTSNGDKDVAELDKRMKRLNDDFSIIAKQAVDRLAIINGKIPLTKFANACRVLADGMAKVSKAFDKKQARMDEIQSIDDLVWSSRERNYSDLRELVHRTAAIKARSLNERREEIALGQRVRTLIRNRESFMGSDALRDLRSQIQEVAYAQIDAELSAFKATVKVSSDAALEGWFKDIDSKAFQLVDLRVEDTQLNQLEKTLHDIQLLAARNGKDL